MSAIIRVENLTDVSVMTRNQAGSIDIGTPRTIWLGIHAGL
jgi:iron complex outermembrane receptor protein